MLLGWENYRNQLLARVSDLGKLTPSTLKGYQALGAAGEQTGHLDPKTRDEVAETLGVAITLGAGAALVYSARTLDAFDAHSGAGRA
jgi:hypothetical protein